MSYVNIWVHAVWGTKSRYPFLTKEIKAELLSHIIENAKSKGIFISIINGPTDHLHALISLPNTMTIADVMQLIKGESSFWINKNNLTEKKFQWCHKYYAASVDRFSISRVRSYIDNQETHHSKVGFSDEYEEFLCDPLISMLKHGDKASLLRGVVEEEDEVVGD